MELSQTINIPLDLPLDQMTPQEKLHHVRALNRFYSSSLSASSTQSIPLDLLQPSAAKYSQKSNGEGWREVVVCVSVGSLCFCVGVDC